MASQDQNRQIGVLFVCIANVCRSPIAEAVFAHLVKESGLQEKIRVDSAATGLWLIGSHPHPEVISILARHDIDYDHTARLLVRQDFSLFDYILGMESDVLRSIWSIASGPASVQPFVKYAKHLNMDHVADPMISGDFEAAYSTILAGCEGFLEHLRKTHGL